MKRLALIPLALLLLTACSSLTPTQVSVAEGEAKSYIQANFPDHEIVNVQCKNRDSDTDGYVRCNLSVKDETGTSTPNIECAYGRTWSWAEGCQQPKASAD